MRGDDDDRPWGSPDEEIDASRRALGEATEAADGAITVDALVPLMETVDDGWGRALELAAVDGRSEVLGEWEALRDRLRDRRQQITSTTQCKLPFAQPGRLASAPKGPITSSVVPRRHRGGS